MRRPRILWLNALRHCAQVLAFCSVIAVVTTAIWPHNSYWNQWVYATLIGLSTWAVMEFGRYLVPARYCHTDHDGGHGWPKGWRGLAFTAAGIVGGFLIGDGLANWLFDRPSEKGRDLQVSLMLTVLAGAVATYYFHARGKAAALAAEIAKAERDASEAKLKLLETQLEPHMLFNTLANLRVLITLDPPRAVAMLDRLNDYLRATLAGSRATQHPLAQEFARLADYLELMAVRMGDRLRFTLDLPDELRGVPVPPLLLQPLVENAIRHGLEPKIEGGEIRVSARRTPAADGERLVLEVADTGVGLPPGHAEATAPRQDGGAYTGGFGVQQVRERLRTLHGERGAMELVAAPAGGTRATVTFPL